MFRRLLPRRSLQSALLGGTALFLPVCIFLIVSKNRQLTPPSYLLDHPYFHYNLYTEEHRNEDQSCVLPRIHPFHPSIWNFLHPPKPITCKYRRPELTFVDFQSHLKFNDSEVENSGYVLEKSLHCYWTPVERGGVDRQDDDTVSYGKEEELKKDGIVLPNHVGVVRVHCKNFAGISVYDMLHAHIRNVTPNVPPLPLKLPINVLIFGIDSMSRLGFIRMLPKTYKYLTQNLKMVVLLGMNKVGDNTYPNLAALLTGRRIYTSDLPDESEGFDNWPLIWRNYSNAGYATMWAEDFPQYGVFNYLAKGFKNPPTLHYLRPFWLALESSPLLKLSSHMCYGSTPKHLLQMDYVRTFVKLAAKRNQTYFAFSFLAEISHEYVSRISSADHQLENFFRFLNEEGHLKNTFLVVMSDHGHRFDAIRSTQVGHVEERMPFFAIRLPETLASSKVMEELNINSARLVTPYDMHTTLLDLLQNSTTGQPLGSTKGHLGLSLFGPIPANRSCSDAYIPTNYCVCESEDAIPTTDQRSLLAATHLLHHINSLLLSGGSEFEYKCTPLRLGQIKASHLVYMPEEDQDLPSTRIRVVAEAEPSKGLFEATLVISEKIEVLGDISRINTYGEQSKCIKHVILRKYCFCKDFNVTDGAIKPNL